MQPIPLHVAYKSGLNAAGVHQEACTECGDCCGGCNIGAKTTVASTYLADAAAFGAEIFTEIRALSLTKGDDGIWQVWVQSASDVRKASLEAAIVVLGAGTLGSTEILLRSQAQGLALSQWLGSRFTSNGDVVAMAYNNDVPVNGIGVGNPPRASVPPVGQAVNALLDCAMTQRCATASPSANAHCRARLLQCCRHCSLPAARCLASTHRARSRTR